MRVNGVLCADCPYVCRLVQCGTHNSMPYLAMELLGDNLSELRRRQKGSRFSLATTVLLGRQVRWEIALCLGYNTVVCRSGPGL